MLNSQSVVKVQANEKKRIMLNTSKAKFLFELWGTLLKYIYFFMIYNEKYREGMMKSILDSEGEKILKMQS